MTIKSVNIVVPLKNEEKSIKSLVENLSFVFKKIDKEINLSLIDDYSTDRTWEVLNEYQKKFSFIKIYKNEYNTGFGNALKFGIEKNQNDAIIIFMGDCSDNPDDIIEYVKFLDVDRDRNHLKR